MERSTTGSAFWRTSRRHAAEPPAPMRAEVQPRRRTPPPGVAASPRRSLSTCLIFSAPFFSVLFFASTTCPLLTHVLVCFAAGAQNREATAPGKHRLSSVRTQPAALFANNPPFSPFLIGRVDDGVARRRQPLVSGGAHRGTVDPPSMAGAVSSIEATSISVDNRSRWGLRRASGGHRTSGFGGIVVLADDAHTLVV